MGQSKFSEEFKPRILGRMADDKSIVQTNSYRAKIARIAELERMISRLTIENDLLKKRLESAGVRRETINSFLAVCNSSFDR